MPKTIRTAGIHGGFAMRKYGPQWLLAGGFLALAGAAEGGAMLSKPEPDDTALSQNLWTDDLDAMKQRKVVRILTVYSKTFYFIDHAAQRGATYELGVELEKELNKTNKERSRPIRVIFIPT